MNLDIGKAFTYVTEDPKWITKVLIGGGLILAGIVTLIGWLFTFPVVFGYTVMVTRNVINGNPQPLPEWDDFGTKWIEGFKAWVVSVVYALPAIIIALIFQIPAGILGNTGNDGAAAAGGLLNIVGGCLNFILSLLVAVILPAAIGRFAASGNIAEGLQFGAVIATVRQNIGMYVIIALLSTFLVPLISGIGIIACFIGAAFTSFYAYLMIYHLYGQAYRTTQGGTMDYGQQYGQPYQQRPF
jgi:hypothetical protein